MVFRCVHDAILHWPCCHYLYAYLKVEIETREREEEIKCEQGKTDFSEVMTIIA